jgi:phage tail-like protein
MATGDRKDPYLGFNFRVKVDGKDVVAGFSEVSGLQAEIEVQDYREGGVNEYIHKLAGPARYPSNLVLKRGISDVEGGLWSWYCDVMQGIIERKDVTVVLMNSAGEEKVKWDFRKAYPVKWAGPGLRATASEIAIESVELAHMGLMPTSQRR